MTATRAARRLSALLALALAASAQAQRADPADASVLALRQAVTFSETGAQHPRLVALRALKDPSMKPLFEALLKAEAAPLRLDGLLGLGELAGDAGVDAESIRAIGDPALRTVALTECLGLQLLRPNGIRAMLAWKDLPAYDRALLVGELNRLHEAWDATLLDGANADQTAEVAGLVALLHLERGDNGPWTAFLAKADGVSPDDRADLMRRLADAARHYELKASIAPLLAATESSSGTDRFAPIATAIALDPPRGRQALMRQVKAEDTPANRTQCGLLMLAGDRAFEPADFAAIRGSSGMAGLIADAGESVRSGGQEAAPLVALMQSGNRPAAEWALHEAAKLPPPVRRAALLGAIDRLDRLEQPSMHDRLLAALATRELIPTDATELASRACRQGSRPEVPEAIVTAMCDLGTPEAATFARMVRGKLPQRGESMALVTIAKTAPSLSPAELRELGRVGGGGGRVEDPIQMQAAWLYLRHANRLGAAVPQLTPR